MNDAGFEEESDQFLQWLVSQPGTTVSDSIALHDYNDTNSGRGVIASKDIAEDELLFSIPRARLLSWHNSDLKSHLSQEEIETLGDWNLLILVMMYEAARADSQWGPYLRILPDTFSTPMFWSDAEIAELQGSTLAAKIGREEADQSYHETLLPIIKKHANTFDVERCSLESFHRMGSLIMSYSFDAPLKATTEDDDENKHSDDDEEEEEEFEKVMCPLADMLNADTEKNNARLFYEPEHLTMRSTTAISAGEQIFNTYGDLPNTDLLRRYGYVQVPNRSDVVEIPGDMITSLFGMSEPERETRIDWMLDMEILDDAFEIEASGKIPKELIASLELMQLSFKDFCQVRDSGDGIPKGSKNEMTQKQVLEILSQRLGQYQTTVEQDEELLRQTNLPYNHRNAVAVRLGEKKILHTAVDVVKSWTVTDASSKKRSANQATPGQSKRNRRD